MKILKKLRWTDATDEKKEHVVKVVQSVFGILMLLGMLYSAITEYEAVYKMTQSTIGSVIYIFIIEVSYPAFFTASALLLTFWMCDKKTYSFLILSIVSFLIGSGIFYVSRSLSDEGKNDLVDRNIIAEEKTGIDSTAFLIAFNSAKLKYDSDVLGINSEFAEKLTNDTKHLYVEKKREPQQLPALKYSLSSIDTYIRDYKKYPPGTWQKKGYNILVSNKSKMRAILRASKASNKESKLIALSKAESDYKAALYSEEMKLGVIAKAAFDKDVVNNGLHEKKKSNFKFIGGVAVWVFLLIAGLAPFVYCIGKYWAGSRPYFEEIHKGSFLYLVSIFFQGKKAQSYNVMAAKVRQSVGDVIEVENYNVKTAIKQTEQTDASKQIEGKQVTGLKVTAKYGKQTTSEKSVLQEVMSDKMPHEKIKELANRYSVDEDYVLSVYSSLLLHKDIGQTVRTNFNNRVNGSSTKKVHVDRSLKIDIGTYIIERLKGVVKDDGKTINIDMSNVQIMAS